MNCTHCKKGFSCGCQKTKGIDGKIVHKSCLKEYNGKMNIRMDPLTKKLNEAKRTVG